MPRETRATTEELEERIEMVRQLISRCCTAGTIKRVVKQKYGPLNFATIWGYINRARKELEADAARGKQILRAESHGFYGSVLADPTAQTKDKLKARERLDKLHGLEAPVQITPVTTDGQPAEVIIRLHGPGLSMSDLHGGRVTSNGRAAHNGE